MNPTELDYAWAGGFLDADGSFSLCRNKHRKRDLPKETPHYHRPQIKCTQVGSCEPLDKLARVLGGRVTEWGDRRFSWVLDNSERIAPAIERLLPYLTRKRPEAVVLRDYCLGPGRQQPRRKTPRSVWAARETFVEHLARVRRERREAGHV